MNTYDPSHHPRATSGEFTNKHRDEPSDKLGTDLQVTPQPLIFVEGTDPVQTSIPAWYAVGGGNGWEYRAVIRHGDANSLAGPGYSWIVDSRYGHNGPMFSGYTTTFEEAEAQCAEAVDYVDSGRFENGGWIEEDDLDDEDEYDETPVQAGLSEDAGEWPPLSRALDVASDDELQEFYSGDPYATGAV